jgi:hypothetical protein
MTNEIPVTLVTKDAGRPEDDEVYMRELLELRNGLARKLGKPPTLAQMLNLLGEPISRKAFWAHRLADPPTRTTFPPDARDIIRNAVGEAPLPAVTEVTANMISPNAAIHLIGDLNEGEKSELVLMIAPNTGPVQIYANGTVHAHSVPHAPQSPVTPVTFSVGGNGETAGRNRKSYFRPCLPKELEARIKASGKSVEELIEAGLEK